VEAAITPTNLSTTRQFQLRHIRGLDTINDQQVAFIPEFLYLLDAGLPVIAGVSLSYNVKGLGDPRFPDFANHLLLSVQGWSSSEIIFPAKAGRLVLTVAAGMPPDEVRRGLEKYASDVKQLAGNDTYLAYIRPFNEPLVMKQIREEVPFVLRAELDLIVRIIDGVHWVEDRVL